MGSTKSEAFQRISAGDYEAAPSSLHDAVGAHSRYTAPKQENSNPPAQLLVGAKGTRNWFGILQVHFVQDDTG
jgi:hypothetical protein